MHTPHGSNPICTKMYVKIDICPRSQMQTPWVTQVHLVAPVYLGSYHQISTLIEGRLVDT